MLQTCWRTCGVRRRGCWRVRRGRRGRTECRSCPASRSSSTSPRTGRAGPSGTPPPEHWARYLLPPERLERGGPCWLLKPVFRIHDILVWIRIRIRGSMPLTDGCRFGSCYFRQWPSRLQQKTNWNEKVFVLITFWRYIYIIFQR